MGFLRPFTLFEWWMLFLNWFSHGNSLWTVNPYHASRLGLHYLIDQRFLVVFQLIFLIILLRGLMPIGGRTAWKKSWELFLFLFSLPLVMLFLNLVGFRQLYIERYLVLILPFFLIVIARGTSGFSRTNLEIIIMVFLVIAAISSCLLFFYKNDTWTVYKQNPDWRSAASYLTRENRDSTELVIFYVTPADTLIYYLRRQGIESFKMIRIKQANDQIPKLTTDNLKAFYLIKNRFWKGRFDKVFQKIKADRRFQLYSSGSFKGMDVYFFKNSG
jgi:hypothetical protein